MAIPTIAPKPKMVCASPIEIPFLPESSLMEPTIDSLCTAGRNAIRRANAGILERIWTRAVTTGQRSLVLTINGRDAHVLALLKARYLTARTELETAYADHNFNYERAVSENQIKEQKLYLQNILPICREDRQPFCDSLELAYQRFPND